MKYNDNGLWKTLNIKVTDTLPVGTIIPYAGATIPSNYMKCEGQALSRIEYDILFSAIGTTYGEGDGSTTFNLPNLKGRVITGIDSNDTDFDTLGETGGEKEHTLTVDEIPTMYAKAPTSTSGGNITYFKNDSIGGHNGKGAGAAIATIAGGDQPHNNLQPYMVLNYIIKVLDAPATGIRSETLPVGTVIDYEGDTIPVGWEEITNPDSYSTDEIKTNKVFMGKPIYRKVVDLGFLGTQTQISYGNQFDTITSFGGYIYQDNGANMSLIEYTSSLWRVITYTITSQHTMNVVINRSDTSAWSDWKLKIVIEYTKTTD